MSATYELDVIIEAAEEGGYVAHVPALRGCHTQGDTFDELLTNVKEAIALCLETGDVLKRRVCRIPGRCVGMANKAMIRRAPPSGCGSSAG